EQPAERRRDRALGARGRGASSRRAGRERAGDANGVEAAERPLRGDREAVERYGRRRDAMSRYIIASAFGRHAAGAVLDDGAGADGLAAILELAREGAPLVPATDELEAVVGRIERSSRGRSSEEIARLLLSALPPGGALPLSADGSAHVFTAVNGDDGGDGLTSTTPLRSLE